MVLCLDCSCWYFSDKLHDVLAAVRETEALVKVAVCVVPYVICCFWGPSRCIVQTQVRKSTLDVCICVPVLSLIMGVAVMGVARQNK